MRSRPKNGTGTTQGIGSSRVESAGSNLPDAELIMKEDNCAFGIGSDRKFAIGVNLSVRPRLGRCVCLCAFARGRS